MTQATTRASQLADALPDSIFLAFGGQGGPFFEELLDLHDSESVAPLIAAALDAVQSELSSPEMVHPEWYPDQFRFDKWIQDPRCAPSERRIAHAHLSGVLILVTQVGHLVRFISRSMSWSDLSRTTGAILGHSQGINAALLMGRHMRTTSLLDSSFLADFASMVKATFWEGHRCFGAYPTEESSVRPAYMVAVGSVSIESVDRSVTFFNAEKTDAEKIYLSLVNSPDSTVLSGPDKSIREFRRVLAREIGHDSFSWDPLTVSAPFHSPHMKDAAALVVEDLRRIGFTFAGSELNVPVFSTEDGANLTASPDIAPLIPDLAMVRPLNWIRVAASVREISTINLGLCFGPGSGVARMTQMALQHTGIRVVPMNRTDLMKRFLERVRR